MSFGSRTDLDETWLKKKVNETWNMQGIGTKQVGSKVTYSSKAMMMSMLLQKMLQMQRKSSFLIAQTTLATERIPIYYDILTEE